MRKIIQVSAGINEMYPATALCDDGTVWLYYTGERGKDRWRVLKPIPQKEIPDAQD